MPYFRNNRTLIRKFLYATNYFDTSVRSITQINGTFHPKMRYHLPEKTHETSIFTPYNNNFILCLKI